MTTIITTSEQIEKAFAEWFKRYQENPSDLSPDDYVESNAKEFADYLIKLLHEVV